MLESLLLASACSLDAFVASIAYGTSKIKIPFTSIVIINIVCSSTLALSFFFGSAIKKFLSGNTSTIISFIGLMLIGVFYLFQSLLKAYLSKNSCPDKKLKFKLQDLQFIIDIYVDETKADLNNSKDISSKEAVYLAIALSLDSMAVGFTSSLGSINYKQVVLFSLIVGMVSVALGLFIGRKIAQKSKLDLSWLSGAILIILAFLKIL